MKKYFLMKFYDMKLSAFLVLFVCMAYQANAQIKVISNGNVGLRLRPASFNENPERQVHMRGVLLIDSFGITSGSEIGILLRKYNATTNPYCDFGIDLDGGGFNIFRGWPNAGWGNFKFFIKESNSYVGINTGTPSYLLDVNGSLRCYSFTNSSDERLKSNIKDIVNGLDVIQQLSPKIYDLAVPINDQSSSTKKLPEGANYVKPEPEIFKNQTGFLAQDVKKTLPHIVSVDEQGYHSLNYIGLIPYLVDAIKEQNKQIEALQEQIQGCCSVYASDDDTRARRGEVSTGSNANSVDDASLEQNAPNPFHQQTTIAYTIPENCRNSSIHIYNLNGAELRSYAISQKGRGSITVDAGSLKAGMYLYTLICDGKEVATKKMILTQ